MSLTQNKISEQFSSYIFLKQPSRGNYLIPQWVIDRFLQGILEELINQQPSLTENDLARRFLKDLLQANILYRWLFFSDCYPVKLLIYSNYLRFCESCLFCYLQVICWQVAKLLNNRLGQSLNINVLYPVDDCYSMACELSLRPDVLLRRYNFSSSVPLRTYAKAALKQAVKDRIAKELKSTAIKLSPLGRLKNMSLSQLKSSLKQYGLRGKLLEQHRLVVNVLKEVWEDLQPTSSSTQKQREVLRVNSLRDEQLSLIVKGYQKQSKRLGWSTDNVDVNKIRMLLETCVEAIQAEKNRRSLSWEEMNSFDEMSRSSNFTPLELAIEKEDKKELSRLKAVFKKALMNLDKNAYNALLLWLGLEINQSDLVNFMGYKKQYQVARQFQRYQREILRQLMKTDEFKNLNAKGEEAEIITLIKEYLGLYSKNFFSELLANVNQSQSFTNLIDEFGREIEQQLQLDLNQIPSLLEKIALFVEEWEQQNLAQLNIKG